MVADQSDLAASELLAKALDGPLIHGVDHAAYPHSVRTYLDDGQGLSWLIPSNLWGSGIFAVDAERVQPPRPSLMRRFGIDDPYLFAQAWTRAEVGAKLFDTPIVVWLKRYGLSQEMFDVGKIKDDEYALLTRQFGDHHGVIIVTFGAKA